MVLFRYEGVNFVMVPVRAVWKRSAVTLDCLILGKWVIVSLVWEGGVE